MSEMIFLKGKASWCRPYKVNQWGKYAMTLHPDQDSLEKIRELQSQGVKNVLQKDEDGGYRFNLSRASEIMVNGRRQGMNPPTVFDGTKPLPDGGYMPLAVNTEIGNGSDVIVKVEVYSHRIPGMGEKRAKAMRWVSLRVDNLVPFQRQDFNQHEEEGLKDMHKQSKQTELF